MADKVINEAIEFAYVSNDSTIELKKELEKRFLYQTVLVVDEKYEFSASIEKMKNNIRCNFVVTRHIDEFLNFENVDCVLVVNAYNINSIKAICKKNNLAYIVVLTKIFETSILCNEFIDQNFNILRCNFPLGVLLDKGQVFNKKVFVSKFLMELFGTSFDETQQKINNLFYSTEVNFEVFGEISNIKTKALENLKTQPSLENIFENSAKNYLIVCLRRAELALNTLDKLMFLYLKSNKSDEKMSVEIRFIYRMIITSLTKNFFELWNCKLKSTIDYKKHIKYLSCQGIQTQFKQRAIVDSKLNFLMCEFRQKLLSYATEQTKEICVAKNLIADISIDYLYQSLGVAKHTDLTNFLCLEPDVFGDESLLSLMSQNGLLNFEF